ncbi:hypothetical protein LCGC14_3168210 [marine sediment metagenome]|uniref:Phage ABA sandwich domain-containing protein n=1 Tax=marine sediment metagenome TaxID=412755 RepID=A0A0F8Y5P6_9ZZZZ
MDTSTMTDAELDIAVATDVMKWAKDEPWLGHERPYVGIFPDGAFNVYTPESNHWSPATDMAHAWEVWEELERQGMRPGIYTRGTNGYRVHADAGGNFWADADTACRAICLAALAAQEKT